MSQGTLALVISIAVLVALVIWVFVLQFTRNAKRNADLFVRGVKLQDAPKEEHHDPDGI